jgi:hypothetical protein
MAWSRFDFFVAMLVVVSATARGATTILQGGLYTTWTKPHTSGKWNEGPMNICDFSQKEGQGTHVGRELLPSSDSDIASKHQCCVHPAKFLKAKRN